MKTFLKKQWKLILFLLFALIVSGSFLMHIRSIDDLKRIIDSSGIWGSVIFVIFIVLQIIVAWIPGELFEIAAGYLFGGLYGILYIIIGTWIGSWLIFYGIRRFQWNQFSKKQTKGKILNKYLTYFEKESNLHKCVFLLYLIPGISKDLFCYIFAFTKIKFIDYFILSMIARFPSVLLSVYGGVSFKNQDYQLTIVLFGIGCVISILGFIIYYYFEKYKMSHGKKMK